MTLKEALLTTPTGYVKNKKLSMELMDWASIAGHVAHGNIRLEKMLKSERWQHDLQSDEGLKASNSIKTILAKKYLMTRI